MKTRYDPLFANLRLRRRGAFGAFVTLGDPDLAASAAILDWLVEAGVDMIEVGIPFSDPIADGPVIQASAGRAIAAGVRPGDCFDLLAGFRARHPGMAVGILTYANLVVARGRESFYRAAAQAGVDSVLVADVPLIEAAPFAAAARSAGIAPILVAAANTPPDRLARIAGLGAGYTYCVARAGVTGDRRQATFDAGHLPTLKESGAPPLVFGFGISRPDQVRSALAAGAAGIICGSAIVRLIGDNPADPAPALKAFLAPMLAARSQIAMRGSA